MVLILSAAYAAFFIITEANVMLKGAVCYMMKKLRGLKLSHRKNTENMPTLDFPLPEKVKIPMAMNMGAACIPLVKAGDEVQVGQKIGDSDAFFSVPVHSGVSGKVTAVTDYISANGSVCKAVEIETDGLQTVSNEVKVPVINDKTSFINAVRESGICGLGGAGFPTHIKLNAKTPIDTLVINAAECEPYITADYREMIENSEDVYNGIKLVMKMLDIKNSIIAVESNKPEAVRIFQNMIDGNEHIKVHILPSSYPQGAEKVIIYNTTGRIVQEGKLPSDAGVIVLNVSTAAFIYRYAMTGMPLVSRRLTVDGDTVGKAVNIRAVIGTSFRDILEYCRTDLQNTGKIIAGGPMMGMPLPSLDMPVVKTTNAILALKKYEIRKQSACIRCGRCVRICPFGIMSADIERAYKIRNIDELRKLKVNLCMNCGSCTYVCPSNRKLAEVNQLAKMLITDKK